MSCGDLHHAPMPAARAAGPTCVGRLPEALRSDEATPVVLLTVARPPRPASLALAARRSTAVMSLLDDRCGSDPGRDPRSSSSDPSVGEKEKAVSCAVAACRSDTELQRWSPHPYWENWTGNGCTNGHQQKKIDEAQ